jgi:hypothetical protein
MIVGIYKLEKRIQYRRRRMLHRRHRRKGSALWRRALNTQAAAMCLAAALLLGVTWWAWLRGARGTSGGDGGTAGGRGGRGSGYAEARAATDHALLRLASSEEEARQRGVANWANVLKDARVDLSRQQASADAEVKRMHIALEDAEVARRRSAVKLLATRAHGGGRGVGTTTGDKLQQANNAAAVSATSAVLSAAAATTSAFDEFSASTLPPLRVFVYDLPPEFNVDLSHKHPDCRWDSAYTWETKYTLEVYLHEMLLKSSLRTLDPKEADLFYMPVYVGCYLHSHGTNFIKTQELIRKSQQWARTHYPYWDRSQGADHVFTLTHDIGACIAPFQELRHAILITNTGELMNRKEAFSVYTSMYTRDYKKAHDLSMPCFSPWKDIVAPPMINDKFMLGWHRAQKSSGAAKAGTAPRNLLATFRGTIIDKPGWSHYSRGIRQKWLQKYEFDDKIKITAVHPREGFGDKAANYQATYRKDFTSSKFCLCPPGWATWTPRLFEALLLGCIPAVIADHNLLPFSRTVDYTLFAVHVSEDKANDLETFLPQSKARVQELQDGVSAVWPAFVYNDPPQPGDAFHHLAAELFWKSRSVQRGQRWG